MTPDITELLSRAVADVVPAERRPTDAVLARAEQRLSARLRKALAGLVGVAVLGGGAAVIATAGNDADDPAPDLPRPVRLTVDAPAEWSVVTGEPTIDCTTPLQARTIYRDAEIGNLGYCQTRQGISVPGPVLLMGHLTEPTMAEQIRSSGTPVEVGGVPGWAVGYDAEFSFVAWLPAGAPDDLAVAAMAPRGPDDVAAYPDVLRFGVPSLPVELLDLVGTVSVEGDLPSDAVLPERVSAVDLHAEPTNVGSAPGARVREPASVAAVLDAMQPPRKGATPCGPTESARTLHLQDAVTHRWARVDVLDDGAGCRRIHSELGGARQVSGDPVEVATGRAEPQSAPVGAGGDTVRAHGLSVSVPDGWEVVRGDSVDPCTLAGPAVVVAGELAPTCDAQQFARPTHPFVWLTSMRLEGLRIFTNDRSVTAVDPGSPAAAVRWTDESLDATGVVMTGLMGVPESGAGRLFVVGLDQRTSLPLRETVRPD